jgi:hypothetical protein
MCRHFSTMAWTAWTQRIPLRGWAASGPASGRALRTAAHPSALSHSTWDPTLRAPGTPPLPPPFFPSFFNKPHCNQNPIYVFPEKELRGLGPNFNIHVYSGS